MSENPDRVPELATAGQPASPGHADAAARPAAPAMPVIRPGEWYDTAPYPLLGGVSPTIGWQNQPAASGGLAFVILARSALGSLKVAGRFPLTEAGWAQAWQVLEARNPEAAARARAALLTRAAAAPPHPVPVPQPAADPEPRAPVRSRALAISHAAAGVALAGGVVAALGHGELGRPGGVLLLIAAGAAADAAGHRIAAARSQGPGPRPGASTPTWTRPSAAAVIAVFLVSLICGAISLLVGFGLAAGACPTSQCGDVAGTMWFALVATQALIFLTAMLGIGDPDPRRRTFSLNLGVAGPVVSLILFSQVTPYLSPS